MTRIHRVILVLLTASTFLFVGCQALGPNRPAGANQNALLPITVTLEFLENVYVGKEPAKEPIIVDMVFLISNPNAMAVTVNQLEWAVRIEEKRLAILSIPERIYIPAKGNGEIRKTYFLNAAMGPVNLLLGSAVLNLQEGAKVFGAIAQAIKEEKARWNLEGTAFVDSEIGSASFPFFAEWP